MRLDDAGVTEKGSFETRKVSDFAELFPVPSMDFTVPSKGLAGGHVRIGFFSTLVLDSAGASVDPDVTKQTIKVQGAMFAEDLDVQPMGWVEVSLSESSGCTSGDSASGSLAFFEIPF